MLQPLRGYTDAAVLHRAGQPKHLIIQGLPAGLHADAAFLGELQRVAEQVDQNLPNARRVALDLNLFQPWLSLQLQLQAALLGAVLEHLGRTLEQLQQIERNALQLQGVALNPGEVENVVDDL